MVDTKVFTKEEYVTLIPSVSPQDYERLKASIKEEGGLMFPIILNQDNVVLDGHHRLRACKELGIPIDYNKRDFTGKPLEELKFVVHANLTRRHLDEFQKAEVAIKFDKLFRKIARDKWMDSKFTSDTAKEAGVKSGASRRGEQPQQQEATGNERLTSPDVNRSSPEIAAAAAATAAAAAAAAVTNPLAPTSAQELGKEFGISGSTIDRVRSIMEYGTPEQLQQMRDKSAAGEKPGVRTMYEQVQSERQKKDLATTSGPSAPQLNKDNLRLINKDFRIVNQEEIIPDSVDLVLVLDFPEPRAREDEAGRVYSQLMQASQDWLREGGILAMHVEQRFLPRAMCERPPLMQFYHILSVHDSIQFYEQHPGRTIFKQDWRPLVVYVKGVRETRPIAPQSQTTDRIGGDVDLPWSNELEFAAQMVRWLSPVGSIIVDPFMGQTKGQVGMACLQQNRTYIGIESETTAYLSALNFLYES